MAHSDSKMKKIRSQLGLTQAALGRRLKCSAILVKKIESGDRSMSDDLDFRLSVMAGGEGCVAPLIQSRILRLQKPHNNEGISETSRS